MALEPTFGGINLEDIKSPECFYIEEEVQVGTSRVFVVRRGCSPSEGNSKCSCWPPAGLPQKRVSIPVMHDDQHGTAIIAGAGLVNAMEVVGKDIAEAKIVVRQLHYSVCVCVF